MLVFVKNCTDSRHGSVDVPAVCFNNKNHEGMVDVTRAK